MFNRAISHLLSSLLLPGHGSAAALNTGSPPGRQNVPLLDLKPREFSPQDILLNWNYWIVGKVIDFPFVSYAKVWHDFYDNPVEGDGLKRACLHLFWASPSFNLVSLGILLPPTLFPCVSRRSAQAPAAAATHASFNSTSCLNLFEHFL